jgi:cell division protein FtsI (penicillin-binding protein 3)
MSNISKLMTGILLSAALAVPAAAQNILDRNGTPLQRDQTSPVQFVLPKTLAALGQRRLSFDAKLSKVVQEQVAAAVEHYQAMRGAAFVMDVDTGEILAMASVERYDPHPDENGLPSNLVTQGLYEVGVSAKAITVAAGLEAGVIKTDSIIDVRKPIKYGKYTIGDFHPANAKISLTEAILNSSNIARAKIAEKLGTDAFKHTFSNYGQLSELEVEGLQSTEPLLPNYWSDLTSATVSYGHGLANSPLQAGVVMAAMANGGYLIKPTIFKIEEKDVVRLPIMSEATSAFMRAAMRKNIVEGSGTKINFKDVTIGGLSGTANKNFHGHYDQTRVLTQFAAVIPADKPKYLVFTTLDEPQAVKGTHGYQVSKWNAAPLAGNIIEAIHLTQ